MWVFAPSIIRSPNNFPILYFRTILVPGNFLIILIETITTAVFETLTEKYLNSSWKVEAQTDH